MKDYLHASWLFNRSIHGCTVFANHQPPLAYTGKLIGVEYLYAQFGDSFCPTQEEVEEQADEGGGVGECEREEPPPVPDELSEELSTIPLPTD